MEKKGKLRSIGIMIGIVWIIGAIIVFNMQDKNKQKKLVTDLKWQMKGVVTKVHALKNRNGFGILEVNMLESNIEDYDRRPDYPYYCIIKNNKAVLIQINAELCMVGDTVEVSGTAQSFRYYNNKRKGEADILINSDTRVYEYLDKQHLLMK